jgi:hypothetical protein
MASRWELPLSSGAGRNAFLVVGGITGLPVLLSAVVVLQDRRQWEFLAYSAGIFVSVLCWFGSLRLTITSQGVTYRRLVVSTTVEFREIIGVGFEEVRTKGPSMARLAMRTRSGRVVSIPIKPFPLRAFSALFSELSRNGIPIDEPGFWHARYLAEQITAVHTPIAAGRWGQAPGPPRLTR